MTSRFVICIFAVLAFLFFHLPACVQGHTTLAGGGSHFFQIEGLVLFSWGGNSKGQLGQGDTSNRPTPTPVTLAPTQSSTPLSVCAGEAHSCVLDDENNLACTGSDDKGQVGIGAGASDTDLLGVPTGVSSVIHVACGANSVLATTTTGALKTWGWNQHGELGVPAVNEVWEAVVSGGLFPHI
jgi:alpha-tubulin suppressor-like RCC1 family protein